jgi:tripartite-type tricarboxylate transporter receptor subunit TctC
MTPHRILTAVAVAAAALAFSATAHAQSAEAVFKGRNVDLLIGFGPGGGNDTWARTVAAHIGRHLPGNPNVIPRNMDGAGGLQVANYLYNAASKTGRVFGLINRGIPLEPLLGGKGTNFDARKFVYLGSPDRDTTICGAMKSASVKTMADLFSQELVVGGTGSGADTVIYPEFLNAVLGTKFKIIKGYKGSNAVALAMARGEVQGACLASDSFDRTSVYREGQVNILFQAALKPDSKLGDVPNILGQAKNTADRQALELFFARVELGRPFVAPPGISADMAKTLRKAFADTFADAVFIADAKKRKLNPAPVSGEELQQMVDNIYASPKEVVARVAAALNSSRDAKKKN